MTYLSILLDKIVPLDAEWEDLREDIEALTAFASEFRVAFGFSP